MKKKWFLMGIIIMLINFSFLMIIANLLAIKVEYENISGFLMLSSLLAIIITFGDYFKYKIYFYTMIIFNILAIVYCLYAAINRVFENWNDLIVMIYFLMIMGLGIIIGVVGQVIYFRRKKHQ